MYPTVGRIVLYTLSENDAAQINRRRTNSGSISERIARREWPIGAQAHIGANVSPGQTFPMIITSVKAITETQGDGEKSIPLVNGQVFLDGCDVFWAAGRREAETPGTPDTWAWPPRV